MTDLGLVSASRVVRIATCRMVGGVEDLAHFWNRVPNRDFDTLLQRHIRRGTALASAAHLDVNRVALDIQQTDDSSMTSNRRLDFKLDDRRDLFANHFNGGNPLAKLWVDGLQARRQVCSNRRTNLFANHLPLLVSSLRHGDPLMRKQHGRDAIDGKEPLG